MSERPLAVVVPVVYDLYFAAILAGVTEAAFEQRLRLSVAATLHEHAREFAILDRQRAETSGALVILPEHSGDELAQALDSGYPIVVVDPLVALEGRIPTVRAAHRSGAEQAMAHLLGLGHRRIAAITGPPGWLATDERRAAYHEGLTTAGITPDPALLVAADFELGPGAAAAGQLLDLAERPTAIFAFNDAIATGALQAARERGLRVPEDLSVVGYDDLKYATVVMPALTTVRQPLAEMGRTGINMLARLVGGEESERLQLELATRLIVRDSTAPPRHD